MVSLPGSSSSAPTFRGEIAACEHIAQFYPDEAVFLDTLFRFVDRGLITGEGVIVIATHEHLVALEARLRRVMIGIAASRLTGAYIPIDAHEALGKFMIDGWPDEKLFLEFVLGLLTPASADGRRVRAFGEMVALLWAEGNISATLRLEHLWNRVCQLKNLPLFCAYPKAGFSKNASGAMTEICAAHSRII